MVFGQAALDIPLTATDAIGSNNGLAIGVDTAATNGIDPELGEIDLPPFPPAGTFEVRFDLTPYAGEPLSSAKDYRNAPTLPFTGVVEYKLIWQLSSGASTFQIGYSLPPEVTINIKDLAGGTLFDSGTLSGTGTYSIPTAFIALNAAFITMTVGDPCTIPEASNPNPAELQTNVQITGVSLGWVNGAGTENVEVWCGPNERVLKLYDGPAINSWPLGTLNYGTQYSWYVVCKDNDCGVQGPNWTFTTVQDTNIIIDSINVYPQNSNNWTGSCNTSSKTEVSLVNGYNTEVGWMVFDVSAIPNNVTINSVKFNGYLYDNSWPYWSITPMGNVNPVTDAATIVFNQVSTHSANGIAYSFNEESGTLNNDWLTRTLGSTVTVDLQSSLSENWFALGILDIDFSTSYYVKFHGWAEANKPFLEVIYSFHGVNTFQFSFDVEDGWNLVSIPGKLPGDQQIDNWWPYRDMGANVFEFANPYQSVTTVTPGVGYWMKHSGDRTYNTGDEWPEEGIKFVIHDPINADSAWNIFGVYEEVVPAAGLTTSPPGLMNGPVYGYSGGYYITTQLVPGHGYWVKLDNDGQIIIPDAALKSNNEVTNWFNNDWGRIIISDAAGKNYTLYAVNGDIDLSRYELPPAPPAGMFDVRFGSGRIAEDINSSTESIEMRGLEYPITVSVENMNIRLQDETGKQINVNVKSGEEITIENNLINKLLVNSGGRVAPIEYALKQNYPNPFNPSTTIKFALPQDSKVNLAVFNVLGEKVVQLADQEMKVGYHQIEFDASHYASGVYLYRLLVVDPESSSGQGFVETKKMILMK